MKLHEIEKVCAPSRPAELLVTCHCGCRLLSIVVEKKRVWAKKEVANKIRKRWQIKWRRGMTFSRQEEVANKPTRSFFFF